MWCGADSEMWCGIQRYGVVYRDVVWYTDRCGVVQTVRYGVVYRDMVWYTEMWCGIQIDRGMWCGADSEIWCGIQRCGVVYR